MNLNLDTELIRQFLLAHQETILTWLVAGLVMLLLARFELRRAQRRAAVAMSEAVATTVAACVPDIAHAVQAASPQPLAEPVEMQRADALRRLALDTVGAVMTRGRWLDELGNLRLADDALLDGQRAGGADPLLVVAPQPAVQAYLAAQRVFEDEAAQVQGLRRDAQRHGEALQALDAEAAHIEQETGSIVLRFEQVNAQAAQGVDGGDYQRFLIQKYNALGQREKEIAQERARLQAQARMSADALAERAHAASRRYREALAPLMEQMRAAWGHGDSPQVFDTWQRNGSEPGREPGIEPYLAPHAPARNAA
ncbi:membrane protein [Cupriavidus sp. P-10]|nr:membrane protein [Cupriavidus sp. P-10]